jgi:energy-coupling factor transporter ATP-binding protein EcfA2
MSIINLQNIRQADGIIEELHDVRIKIEQRINLEKYSAKTKPLTLNNNKIMRVCLLAGLSNKEQRSLSSIEQIQISKTGNRIFETLFTLHNLGGAYSALLKLRYQSLPIDWENTTLKSKIVNAEILRGRDVLLKDDVLDDWLLNTVTSSRGGKAGAIPFLNLNIGSYEDEIPALLNLNGRDIPNTQILVAGTTGSGKSNLLAVLLNEIRSLSIESPYPVNFLLFDYKGEFSDPANNAWLTMFEVDRAAILDPIVSPLPFTPFKDFTGRAQNEINLYSTELAIALCSIDRATISANMSNRLSEAIINAYKRSQNHPVTFDGIIKEYPALQSDKDKDKDDSVKSVLKQLIRNSLFANEDRIDLIKDSYIVKMDGFPKDGPIAKAIVYFIVSKLNIIYEKLAKQAVDEDTVELRHFTIIDEAHYMLGFDNKPLRDLIAIGRNKGLSIILATQNMDSYKSEYFDFYANAQYPLIMKQQSINDGVIKDLFGVSGKEFQEIKEAIAGLQKGELIIKNPLAVTLGMGKKYKKIKVRHLI